MDASYRVAAVSAGAGMTAVALTTAVVGPTVLAAVAGIGAAVPVGFIYALLLLDAN